MVESLADDTILAELADVHARIGAANVANTVGVEPDLSLFSVLCCEVFTRSRAHLALADAEDGRGEPLLRPKIGRRHVGGFSMR